MADPAGAGQRDFQVPGDLPQPEAAALGDRLANTRRFREETTEHRGLRIRKRGSTEAGTCQSL